MAQRRVGGPGAADIKLNGFRVLQSKMNYLHYVRQQCALYGSLFYPAWQSFSRKIGKSVLIAVNREGICVLRGDDRQMAVAFPYAHLASWNADENLFVVNKKDGSNYKLESWHADEIYHLAADYVRIAMA